MKTVTWVILAIAGVAVAGIAAWYFTRSRKDAIMSRCSALQAELARISTQGGDTSRANELRAQIQTCLAEAEAAGFEIDYTAVAITQCNQFQTQIDQEWEHYKSTAYEDVVKRNNARGQILKLGGEMAQCYAAVLDQLTTADELRNLRSKIGYAISQSTARATCFYDSAGQTQSGCSRYGYNEPEGRERSNDEIMRVREPLRAVYTATSEKLRKVDAESAAAEAARTKEIRCANLRGNAAAYRRQGREDLARQMDAAAASLECPAS